MNAMATDSLTKMDNTRWRVKPRVLSSATSRVRLRTDIAMVLAETSMMANITAPQMLRMNAFTLPKEATNPNWKAFSLSVFVCNGELRNISSTVLDTRATSSAVAT